MRTRVNGHHIPVGKIARRPLIRLKLIPVLTGKPRQRMQIKRPCPVILKCRQCRMFTKNFLRMFPGKGLTIAQLFRHLGNNPPVRFCLAQGSQKGALARNPPFGVGDRTVFLSPAQRRETNVGVAAGVGLLHHLRNNDQRTVRQRLAYRVTIRQRDSRIGAHDPYRLHITAGNGVKQINGHQARRLRQPFGSPETRHPREIVRLEVHVSRQLIRESPHFPSPHRVWLAGQRKRPAALTGKFPARKMDVNDGVALVAAAGRLVDPHGVERNGTRRREEPVVKRGNLLCIKTTKPGHAGNRPVVGTLDQVEQTDKQPGVTAGRERQMQVGDITGGGFTRIDHHHFHLRIVLPRLNQPLIKHRMRPCRV